MNRSHHVDGQAAKLGHPAGPCRYTQPYPRFFPLLTIGSLGCEESPGLSCPSSLETRAFPQAAVNPVWVAHLQIIPSVVFRASKKEAPTHWRLRAGPGLPLDQLRRQGPRHPMFQSVPGIVCPQRSIASQSHLPSAPALGRKHTGVGQSVSGQGHCPPYTALRDPTSSEGCVLAWHILKNKKSTR